MNDWIRKGGLATGLVILGAGAAGVAPAGASAPGAPIGCTTSTATAFELNPVAIADVATTTDVIHVAGIGTNLLDVDVFTDLAHTFPGDLDIAVTSPAGTVVTLSTDNGASNDGIFEGTTWDDQADDPVTDHLFALGVTEPDLSPEEPLSGFLGEDPNGDWTITVRDDTAVDVGTLNSWSLTFTTISGPIIPVVTQQLIDPEVAINDGGPAVEIPVNLFGMPYVYDVDVLTNITHTFPADIDMELVSPAGTTATLTTDNGGSNDNVFAGTIWDDDADPGSPVPYAVNPDIVSDHTYTNGIVAPALTPEEPLGTFRGEDPNGTWTLRVNDDAPIDLGTVHTVGIRITSLTCAVPPTVPPPPPPLTPPTPPVTAPTGHDLDTVAGADRVATAIKVSQSSFDDDVASAVVLARSDSFPDALAGTPLAAAKGGPMLLSPSVALPGDVEHEIDRVLPAGGDVYLLGGSSALGPDVANRLSSVGYAVHRIAGENRFETAVAIAGELGSPQTVLEASGLDFPDAVSAGAAAIEAGGAILLTNGATQAPATAAYLANHPSTTRFAVGGPAASADPSATGLVGFDRFETSALVATRFFPSPTVAGIASGRAFPDALTGGVQVGVAGGPMLLTEPGDLPAPVTDFLDANASSIDHAIIYGGPAAVSPAVADEVADAIT